jgi:hypothetical protein
MTISTTFSTTLTLSRRPLRTSVFVSERPSSTLALRDIALPLRPFWAGGGDYHTSPFRALRPTAAL